MREAEIRKLTALEKPGENVCKTLISVEKSRMW
jgi:hypothetical protein